jgi:DNA primase
VYTGELVELPLHLYESKFAPFNIPYETIVAEGIKYAPAHDRIYFPIYDYRRYQIGELLRAVGEGVQPKALTNKFSLDVPFFHVPLCSEIADSLVLVEDITSALKVSQVAPAAALLGTTFTDEALGQFRAIGVKKIMIMLDGDWAGINSSTRLARRLLPFFQTSIFVPPKGKDPKHLDRRYLETTFSKYIL